MSGAQDGENPDVTAKEVWFGGTINDTARDVVENAGWRIEDATEDRLLPPLAEP